MFGGTFDSIGGWNTGDTAGGSGCGFSKSELSELNWLPPPPINFSLRRVSWSRSRRRLVRLYLFRFHLDRRVLTSGIGRISFFKNDRCHNLSRCRYQLSACCSNRRYPCGSCCNLLRCHVLASGKNDGAEERNRQ